MRLLFLLALAAAVTASAQYYDNAVLRGLNNGIRMAEQIRSAEALHETAETLKVERDRIRAETELLREQTLQLREQQRALGTSSEPTRDSDRAETINQTIAELSATYGDIAPYGKRMLQFKEVFLTPPAELRGDQLHYYVLGLYLLARFHDDPEFRPWLASTKPPALAPDAVAVQQATRSR